VRFATEIAGVEEIGLVNRGEHAEITTLEQAIDSELSGNLVDVCPVGALTSKPYAFVARPWELRKTDSVDVLDAVGSNIRVDTRGRDVMRVLPRLHEGINEEWINDKTRHACDGLSRQRLDRPYLRNGAGRLEAVSWDVAFKAIAGRLKGLSGDRIAALAGDLCDAESMLALKDLMTGLGSPNLDCRQDGAKIDADCRAGYLFNTSIAGIEQADAVLIVGSNPRWEAALVNARLRKRFLQGGVKIGLIGQQVDLTYAYDYLGAGPETLAELAAGKGAFAEILQKAERPMLILGMGALARPDGAAVLAAARKLAESVGMIGEGWNGFNVLHSAAARVGGLDLGFLPGKGGRDTAAILKGCEDGSIEVLYLLGADEIPIGRLGESGKGPFVIYQGHHGDAGAHRADVILPGAAYTEKNATYVNTEGRVQLARLAAFPPGEAREDWTILRALSAVLGKTLPFDNAPQLRAAMFVAHPHLALLDMVVPADGAEIERLAARPAKPGKERFGRAVEDFYLTNPIARASAIMANVSAFHASGIDQATGIDG
jgi:NADH-quinone oxidoreductase subunit G